LMSSLLAMCMHTSALWVLPFPLSFPFCFEECYTK
jgi:hypothetical protein